jgi:PhnB protein
LAQLLLRGYQSTAETIRLFLYIVKNILPVRVPLPKVRYAMRDEGVHAPISRRTADRANAGLSTYDSVKTEPFSKAVEITIRAVAYATPDDSDENARNQQKEDAAAAIRVRMIKQVEVRQAATLGSRRSGTARMPAVQEKQAMKREDVKPIPEGYHAVTPVLTVHDAAGTIEFYKEAFGAEERFRMPTPDGKGIAHAELKIGDSVFMLGEEMPGYESASPHTLGSTTVSFYIYVKDVDEAFDRAVSAGATVKYPLDNMFWGDRTGTVADPSGHLWTLATHVEDVSDEELAERGREAFEKMLQEAGNR